MGISHAKRNIVGLCGSIRTNSYNLGLLRAFGQLLPEDVSYRIADISDLPFLNEDREQPYPEAVVRLRDQVSEADALIISAPEYNLSYPAVLKNALEWISRRGLQANLAGKPVALIGAAAIGVSVSQSHLRDVLFALNVRVLTRPIVHIGNARQRFDAEGNPTDPAIQEQLGAVKDALLQAITTTSAQ